MFNAARLKLTAWYIVIIMVISVSFSAVMYQAVTQELDRVERMQRIRQDFQPNNKPVEKALRVAIRNQGIPKPPRFIDPELIKETKERVLLILGGVNLTILILAGGAGYFLATVTLRPIQEMLNRQRKFVADASHELRTPLTALRAEMEVALMDKTLTSKDAHTLIQSNMEEVISLQELTDRLIFLTRQEHKYHSSTQESKDISQLLKSAIKKVKPLSQKKDITIAADLEVAVIFCTPASIIELFIILFDNAIKYSAEETTIRTVSKLHEKTVTVTISDSGVGIAEDDLERVFDRFYRSDSSRAKSAGGFGLGLSIAKEIVQSHNGSIHIDSKQGKGTTVHLSFPITS